MKRRILEADIEEKTPGEGDWQFPLFELHNLFALFQSEKHPFADPEKISAEGIAKIKKLLKWIERHQQPGESIGIRIPITDLELSLGFVGLLQAYVVCDQHFKSKVIKFLKRLDPGLEVFGPFS